jgi:hypothetical protein
MALTKITTDGLSDNAITADKIASGAVTVADIPDGEITAAKLHTTAISGKLGYTPVSPTDLALKADTTTVNTALALKATIDSTTGAVRLPVGTTAQRPASPVSGSMRFNTTSSVVEFYSNSTWVGIGLKDGSSFGTAASSAAAIKVVNPNVTNGIYWLLVPNVNSGVPFQCYCDFVIDGGIGYAMIVNQYFTANEEGPSFTTMAAGNSGAAAYDSEYSVSPNAMLANYGVTKLAVFARTNNGSSAGGIQSASTYRWVRFSGPTSTQYTNIFNNKYDTNQFTGSFLTADGNTGTAYFPNSHTGTGGVTQVTNGATVNDNILYEYKPQGGTDPNHYWVVAHGRTGDTYWGTNPLYQSSGALVNRWGGILIY